MALALGLALSAVPAHAAAPPDCGKTTKDAIAAAEKALGAEDAQSEKQALACMLKALKELDELNPMRRHPDGQLILQAPLYTPPGDKK